LSHCFIKFKCAKFGTQAYWHPGPQGSYGLLDFKISYEPGQSWIKVGVGPRHCTTVGPLTGSISHLSASMLVDLPEILN